jgi:hypothetical protein
MQKILTAITLLTICLSCEKDIDLNLPTAPTQLIVEAYISNQGPEYNYVVLSNSVDYYNPTFQSIPARNAQVNITEGTLQPNNTIAWSPTSTTLTEINNPQAPTNLRNGFYADARILTNPNQALRGTIGKHYRLNIFYNNQNYIGYTNLLQPVLLDSVTYGNEYFDDTDSAYRVRITAHYKDPDTLGNTQFYYWRNNERRNNIGWAGLIKSRAPGRDDTNNGEYIRLTHPGAIKYNDTITYMLTSVTRNTHSFWDSYITARDNGGPFATPVKMKNYIIGQNVIGCFMGLSVSEKTIITKK